MKIAVVAAAGLRGELGRNGELPWKIKQDLEFFKNLTTGQVVVMGRKTFETLPNAINNRTIIVLTTKDIVASKVVHASDVLIMHNVADVMKYAYEQNLETLYIAGGGAMYKHFLPLADQLYLTVVEEQFDADVFFPVVEDSQWELKRKEEKDDGNYSFSFNYFERKQGQG